MRPTVSRGWLGLLAAGAVSVLLIGAFAPSNPIGNPVVAQASATPAEPPSPQPAVEPPREPIMAPGLAEIARLARAHVDDSTIIAFIRNSGKTYTPGAEDILYLKGLGLSESALAALYSPPPPAPAVTASAIEPEPVQAPVPATTPYAPTYFSPAIEPPSEMQAAIEPVQPLPALDGSCNCQRPGTSIVYSTVYSPVFLLPVHPAGNYLYHASSLTASARAAHLQRPVLAPAPRVVAPLLPPLPPAPPMPAILARAAVPSGSKSGK